MLDQITEIQKLKLHENEVLIVKIPVNNLPHSVWHRRAADIKGALSTYLLTNKILVINDEVKFAVIEKDDIERDYTEHF